MKYIKLYTTTSAMQADLNNLEKPYIAMADDNIGTVVMERYTDDSSSGGGDEPVPVPGGTAKYGSLTINPLRNTTGNATFSDLSEDDLLMFTLRNDGMKCLIGVNSSVTGGDKSLRTYMAINNFDSTREWSPADVPDGVYNYSEDYPEFTSENLNDDLSYYIFRVTDLDSVNETFKLVNYASGEYLYVTRNEGEYIPKLGGEKSDNSDLWMLHSNDGSVIGIDSYKNYIEDNYNYLGWNDNYDRYNYISLYSDTTQNNGSKIGAYKITVGDQTLDYSSGEYTDRFAMKYEVPLSESDIDVYKENFTEIDNEEVYITNLNPYGISVKRVEVINRDNEEPVDSNKYSLHEDYIYINKPLSDCNYNIYVTYNADDQYLETRVLLYILRFKIEKENPSVYIQVDNIDITKNDARLDSNNYADIVYEITDSVLLNGTLSNFYLDKSGDSNNTISYDSQTNTVTCHVKKQSRPCIIKCTFEEEVTYYTKTVDVANINFEYDIQTSTQLFGTDKITISTGDYHEGDTYTIDLSDKITNGNYWVNNGGMYVQNTNIQNCIITFTLPNDMFTNDCIVISVTGDNKVKEGNYELDIDYVIPGAPVTGDTYQVISALMPSINGTMRATGYDSVTDLWEFEIITTTNDAYLPVGEYLHIKSSDVNLIDSNTAITTYDGDGTAKDDSYKVKINTIQ